MIEFKNVYKTYPNGFTALKNISLQIEQGEFVAIIGLSGAGKSTILRCINRMHDITKGELTVDGVDVREVEIASLRDQIAVVFQDNFLFSGTIRDNILIGRPGATEADLKEAVKHAHLDEFIASLKDGLNTVLGERGITLSGGQRQRVAIARAFIKNAPVIVLDEATSGLDPVVRDELIDLLLDFVRDENHAILISSHIVSDLEKLCDTIAFLHKGKLLLCEDKDTLREEYALWHGTAGQLEELDKNAIVSRRVTAYGAEALVKRELVPAGSTLTPVSIEELFVLMVKGENMR